MAQVAFFIILVMGLFCVGGFLWSVIEEKPRATWLLAAGLTIIVGIAGLVIYR